MMAILRDHGEAAEGDAAWHPARTVGRSICMHAAEGPRRSQSVGSLVSDLRPGRAVRVRIVAEEHKDVLVVPREAVVTDENGDSVVALVEGDQAIRKTVTAGFQEDGQIEVAADGLKEGDVVVTAGAFGLPQATKVKVVE